MAENYLTPKEQVKSSEDLPHKQPFSHSGHSAFVSANLKSVELNGTQCTSSIVRATC